MLKEFVETLAEFAKKADGAKDKLQIVPTPDGNAYYEVDSKGDYKLIDKQVDPRVDELYSLGELADYLDSEQLGVTESCALYLSENGVLGLLNNNPTFTKELRHRVHVTLTMSKEVATLYKDHQALPLANLVRQTLPEALGDDLSESLFRVLSRLNWSEHTTGHEHRGQSRDSMGAEAVAEITSDEGDLKEFERLTLNLRIFDDPAVTYRHPVKCLLVTNTRERLFRLVPIGFSYEEAMFSTLNHIRDNVLSEIDYPIYLG